jgi:hypothetical protein
MSKSFVGLDPGPSTGISVLTYSGEIRIPWTVHAFQCTGDSVPFLLQSVIQFFRPLCVAIEQFEARPGSAGTTGKDADLTRMIVGWASNIASSESIEARYHTAGQVKPWATDKRLERIKFPLGPKFKDARDSGRHALYSAVRYYGVKDPLS